jgi:haloalkane dehalogenase
VGWRREYPFESKFLGVDGGQMHYVDEGSGPVVVCVHGNPTWSFYWRRLISELRDTHRVIAMDHVGCGLSDKPQDWPYRLDGHINNASALLDHLGVRDVTLVVHDWGGAIGSGVAVRQPDRVANLVVTNTAAWPSARIPTRIAVCRIPGLGAVGVRGFNGFAGAAVFMASERGLSPEAKQGLLFPYGSWADRIATLRFVEDIPMEANHPTRATLQGVADGLASLTGKPMHLVWGMKDWCFTPAFLDEWAGRFPAATVTRLPDVGHYVMEDAPEAVIGAVRELTGRAA